jgi:hypothetical protein
MSIILPSGYIYDLENDGSEVWRSGTMGSVLKEKLPSATVRAYLGFSDQVYTWSDYDGITIIFSYPRTVSTFFFMHNSEASINTPLYYSKDTTDGLDGTWTFLKDVAPLASISSNADNFHVLNQTGIKGLRAFSSTTRWFRLAGFAVFGETAPLDGLVPWHPTLDQPLNSSDYDRGLVTIGGPGVDQTFRLKNMSSTLTANSVTIGVAGDTAFGSLPTEVTFSLNNSTFAATQTITSIAPGAFSSVIYMRRGAATDSISVARLASVRAEPLTWT